MTLYVGNRKIKEKSSPGLYYGSRKIVKAYMGSRLVYEWSPYTPSEVLYYADPASYSSTLPKGVYQIAIGSGQCGYWQSGVTASPPTAWYTSRGGGSFVELIFYNPSSQSIVISAPNAAAAYFNLGGTRMITCNAVTSNSSTGATYSINTSDLDIIKTIKASKGNNGGTGPWSPGGVSSVSNYGNWGSSSNQNGGARLQYLRSSK